MKNYVFVILSFITFYNSNANYNLTKTNYSTTMVADEYEKIKSSDLPPAVVEEILKQYPTSKLRQAYKNDKNTFKLVMVLKSGTARTVYIDAYGRWIQKK